MPASSLQKTPQQKEPARRACNRSCPEHRFPAAHRDIPPGPVFGVGPDWKSAFVRIGLTFPGLELNEEPAGKVVGCFGMSAQRHHHPCFRIESAFRDGKIVSRRPDALPVPTFLQDLLEHHLSVFLPGTAHDGF